MLENIEETFIKRRAPEKQTKIQITDFKVTTSFRNNKLQIKSRIPFIFKITVTIDIGILLKDSKEHIDPIAPKHILTKIIFISCFFLGK